MTSDSFETLRQVVESASVANDFYTAVHEWNVVELEEDPNGDGECVCGQQNLVKLFTIRNYRNNAELFPIGSQCVNHFGRADLDLQVTVFSGLLSLRKSILTGERITLTSEYFSRGMLQWLHEEGAFADERNGFDGEKDYAFLLKMFNKRNKDDISQNQKKKIYVMLTYKVTPFVRDHKALG
jgi:hypothetical protein